MNQNDYTPDRTPTPEQIAAWVDRELSRGEADRVEAWMADHSEARRNAESMAHLTRLYRDQPVPMPSATRWQSALDQIRPRVAPTPGAAPKWRLLLGLTLASAALVGAVVLTRNLLPTPTPTPELIVQTPLVPAEEDEEPFAVARRSEVHIIRMDAEDADRVVTGQPLIGTMDFAGQGDIDVVKVQADPDEGYTPRLERRAGLPWVVLAKPDEEDEI
jgi:anti-sigma factor RsiW